MDKLYTETTWGRWLCAVGGILINLALGGCMPGPCFVARWPQSSSGPAFRPHCHLQLPRPYSPCS